jgi:teichuronic acid biosynthesis glycosyltransferase TuaC
MQLGKSQRKRISIYERIMSNQHRCRSKSEEMSITHLAIITSGYPSPPRPANTTFVKQLAHAVARQGVRCTVIQPVAFHERVNRKDLPFYTIEQASGGMVVQVFRPFFVSLSSRTSFARFGKLNPGLITLWSFIRAVKRIIKNMADRPDVLYGHFLYLAGAAALKVGKELRIPAFPGMGESVKPGNNIWTTAQFAEETAKNTFSDIRGLIVNSSLLKKMSSVQLSIPETQIGVFPNGIDPSRFYPRDKVLMRKRYGLPLSVFLVGCVGHFSHRKGQQRILDAMTGLENSGVLFIGGGVPNSSFVPICFNQVVSHEKVPELLSACDAFVLPTTGEGSSNAIVEAMACGLPIVSSSGEFNDDLLTDDMSIRINPLNVNEIRKAICTLHHDPALRADMAEAALKRSRQFDINDRTRRILNFMTEKMNYV